MIKKKFVKIFLIFFLIIFFISIKLFKKSTDKVDLNSQEDVVYNSNIIKDVEYTTKDKDGNEYYLKAGQGEIDFENSNIIYLTDVYALIKLENSENVTIYSDFGKYNSDNYDTIFTKNVIINYLENKITGEYLDFSISRNSLIISRDVVYRNINNTITADVIEMNINTKDTKIYMYNNQKKVNIKNYN